MKDVLSDILDTIELKGALYFAPTFRHHLRSACRPMARLLGFAT
jgi:hypothetical protein